jgi:hypothetical protein
MLVLHIGLLLSTKISLMFRLCSPHMKPKARGDALMLSVFENSQFVRGTVFGLLAMLDHHQCNIGSVWSLLVNSHGGILI